MGNIIIVNIKKFNYREHNYVVHNYNAPPTALRKEWGIKLMEENSYQQGQGFMRSVSKALCEERQGMAKEKSQHAESLSVSLSSR